MRTWSRDDLVRLWEAGEGQHPVDRALSLLGAAFPELAWEQLVALSVGERDRLLLDLRERLFGASMSTFAQCPACGESLEFQLEIPALRQPQPDRPITSEYNLVVEDVAVRYRLPNSADLAAIAHYHDVAAARELLLRRCVLEARQAGREVPVASLPETVGEALAADMEATDPQAELQISLTCPECQHQWSVLLDAVSFLWTELSAQVRHLLRSVHVLARYYGWSESEILAMRSQRRQLYLEMAS